MDRLRKMKKDNRKETIKKYGIYNKKFIRIKEEIKNNTDNKEKNKKKNKK